MVVSEKMSAGHDGGKSRRGGAKVVMRAFCGREVVEELQDDVASDRRRDWPGTG